MNRLNAFAYVCVPYVAEKCQINYLMGQDKAGAERVQETIIRRQAFYYGAALALLAYEVAPCFGEWSPLCCVFSGVFGLAALGAGGEMYKEFKEIRNPRVIVPEVQGNAS